MVTFGELIAVADARRVEVAGLLRQPGITEQANHPATAAELVRLTRVIGRYTDQIAAGFGISNAPDQGVRDAARRVGTMIRQAGQLLGEPSPQEPDGPDLAWSIRAAAQTLGCGLDLLASHFTEPPGESRRSVTGNAAVIAAVDTGRSLLHTAGVHAAVAGHVALQMGATGQRPGQLLLKAAFLAVTIGLGSPAPVAAVPLQRVPERLSPTPGEALTQALDGIGVSAQRLDAVDAKGSITTWRYLARVSAITCDINNRLLRQLARRLRELDQDESAQAIMEAGRQIKNIGQRWQTIARNWHQLTIEHGAPTTEAAVDGGDLILRLGRLVYDDPAWSPGRRAIQRVIPTERLAPTITDAGLACMAALRATEACNSIARQHRTAVNDIAVLSGLRDGFFDSRLRPTREIRQLLIKYERVLTCGHDAVTGLSGALQLLAPNLPHVTDEATLIMRRSSAGHEPSPAAMAAADFPIPIGEALRPSAPAKSQPPSTTPTSTRGRITR